MVWKAIVALVAYFSRDATPKIRLEFKEADIDGVARYEVHVRQAGVSVGDWKGIFRKVRIINGVQEVSPLKVSDIGWGIQVTYHPPLKETITAQIAAVVEKALQLPVVPVFQK